MIIKFNGNAGEPFKKAFSVINTGRLKTEDEFRLDFYGAEGTDAGAGLEHFRDLKEQGFFDDALSENKQEEPQEILPRQEVFPQSRNLIPDDKKPSKQVLQTEFNEETPGKIKHENIDLTKLYEEITGEKPPKQEKAIAGELSEAAKYYQKHGCPPPDADIPDGSRTLNNQGGLNLNFTRRLPVTKKNKNKIDAGVKTIPQIKKYDNIIKKYAGKYGIDPLLIKCMIYQESQFKPSAGSNKGARGLMQLMPKTASAQGVKNPLDPEQNIAGGVKYFAKQMKKFGNNVPLALAAYNAGPGNVKNGQVPLKQETQDYVYNVIEMYKKLSGS